MRTTTLKIPPYFSVHIKSQSESMLMCCMGFMLDICHIFTVHKGLGFFVTSAHFGASVCIDWTSINLHHTVIISFALMVCPSFS